VQIYKILSKSRGKKMQKISKIRTETKSRGEKKIKLSKSRGKKLFIPPNFLFNFELNFDKFLPERH
jgi:hypothetical protein